MRASLLKSSYPPNICRHFVFPPFARNAKPVFVEPAVNHTLELKTRLQSFKSTLGSRGFHFLLFGKLVLLTVKEMTLKENL